MEEEITRKRRRGDNRGVCGIFGGKRRKSPDLISFYERSELLGRGPTESLRALGADADKDINLSVNVRWGLDGCLLDKLALARGQVPLFIDVRPVAGHREMTVVSTRVGL